MNHQASWLLSAMLVVVGCRRAVAKACLERELPKEYDPAHADRVPAILQKCLGTTGEEIDKNAPTGFRFGKDARNGRPLEVKIFCDDICPTYAGAAIAYADVTTEVECVCIGGEPVTTWVGTYMGCRPLIFRRDRPAPRPDYVIDTMVMAGQPRLVVFDGDSRSRMKHFGFWRVFAVVAIDGRAVKERGEIERVLARMPDDPPSVVEFWSERLEREVHYVPRNVVEDLGQRAAALLHDGKKSPPLCKKGDYLTLWFTSFFIAVDESCQDDNTRAWLDLIAAIEREAKSPHERATEKNPDSCSTIGRVPMTIAFTRGRRMIELNYVGWLSATNR